MLRKLLPIPLPLPPLSLGGVVPALQLLPLPCQQALSQTLLLDSTILIILCTSWVLAARSLILPNPAVAGQRIYSLSSYGACAARCVPWRDQLEIPDVLDHLDLLGAGPVVISINGELCQEHPVLAAPGCVVHVAPRTSDHFTLPLNMFRDRCVGVQALHFRSRGPLIQHMASHATMRQSCHAVVDHARSLLGEHLAGNRFLVAGMNTPPLICCAGTPLPPSLAQVQRFWDEGLRAHFGAITLRDIASVQYDVTLFVQRQDSIQRRIWLLPREEGIDSIYGDIDGFCLASTPAPAGRRLEPSVCTGWAGLARLQPAHAPAGAPITEIVRMPPGLSSSSEEEPIEVHNQRDLEPDEARLLARWAARSRRMQGSAVQHSATKEAAVSSSSSSGSASSSTDDVRIEPNDAADGHSLLQTVASQRCHPALLANMPPVAESDARALDARHFHLQIARSATVAEVTHQLAAKGLDCSAAALVPLHPTPAGGPTFLCRCPSQHLVTVAARRRTSGRYQLAVLPAAACGADVAAVLAVPPQTLFYCELPAREIASLFPGMVFEVVENQRDEEWETTPVSGAYVAGQSGARPIALQLASAPLTLCLKPFPRRLAERPLPSKHIWTPS